MDKLNMETPDLTDKNINQIEALSNLFPNVITETRDEEGKVKKAVDFDLLRQILSKDLVEDGDERYRLDWPGKKASLLKANTPITKTLRPCREESVNFDTTENLFIEGDNFEVLKILQESYLGKVKMIYIDPPYNTGNDFIYKDDFKVSKEEYEDEIGVIDVEGDKLFKNTDNNGRFHSDWLTMMYERLIISRDLLKDNGVVFISIDNVEITNLSKMCDEIFGSVNRIGIITVVSNLKGRSDDKYYATSHNYLLAYQKNEFLSLGVALPEEYLNEYTESTSDGRKYRLQGLRKRGDSARRVDRPNMYYPFYASPSEKSLSLEKTEQHTIEILPFLSNGDEGRWRWGRDTAKERINELCSNTVGLKRRYDVFQIDFAEGVNGVKRIKPKTVWSGSEFANESGSLELKTLLGKKFFDTPKPTGLLKYCLEHATTHDDVILDFFSGSATTADAVMQLNAEDNGNRKFIMVQLPEETNENSEACKAGFKTIADIGKERIRRAGKKILEENADKLKERKIPLDIGFRVYKTDTSNMKDVFYHPSSLKQDQLDFLESNIKEDRTPEDLLTQVLLDLGLELSLPIEQKKIKGNDVFFVQTNSLVACFDEDINFEIIDEIAKLEPLKVVFKDASFKDDKDRINVEERFKRLSPETKISVL